MARFQARVEAIAGGGHYVIVPEAAAAKAALEYRMRVRGTVAGAPYRSSLMKYGGQFHMGVHKATLAQAGKVAGDTVRVEIEADPEPLPEDSVPDVLASALARDRAAGAAWAALAPSHRREHVRFINDAKRAETRAARVDKTLAMLAAKTKTKTKAKTKTKTKPKMKPKMKPKAKSATKKKTS